MSRHTLLIIDDDQTYLNDLLLFLARDYDCTTAGTIREGEHLLLKNTYDLIILDIHFGGKRSGLDLLKGIQAEKPGQPVFMITRHNDVETVVTAMKNGAMDYMTKPVNYREMQIRLDKIFNEQALVRENRDLKEKLRQKEIPFFGSSPAIRDLKESLYKIAPMDTPVLFTGETGTGKEIAARALHRQSPRGPKPFYVINCNAIPEHLIESELFGYEKGAFTGAVQSKPGKLELADGSTLLIDEIGDLSPVLQVKLLNFLETQTFYRLGGNNLIRTDIRFLFATNRNLADAVKKGCFREDLFYRITVFPLTIPPLRERKEDIAGLVSFYLDAFGSLTGRGTMTMSDEALDYVIQQPWPGNIRELKNAIERACILADGDIISTEHVRFFDESDIPCDDWIDFSLDYTRARKKALGRFQKRYIEHALQQCNGNITKAAERINLPRPSLQRMIKEMQ